MRTDGAIARLKELDRDTVLRVLELLRNVYPHDLERREWRHMLIEDVWVEFFTEVERRVTDQ